MSACPSEMQLALDGSEYEVRLHTKAMEFCLHHYQLADCSVHYSRPRTEPKETSSTGATLLCCTSPTRLSVQADAAASSSTFSSMTLPSGSIAAGQPLRGRRSYAVH